MIVSRPLSPLVNLCLELYTSSSSHFRRFLLVDIVSLKARVESISKKFGCLDHLLMFELFLILGLKPLRVPCQLMYIMYIFAYQD